MDRYKVGVGRRYVGHRNEYTDETGLFKDEAGEWVLHSDHLAALAREREAALEEARRALCPCCNDPAWPEASELGFHTSPYTGSNFYCEATEIRALKAVGVNQAAG